uniref:CCHC-type domain-containing protein n=1 Tax=Oryzias latipes TaxID=8090 RepID=A0A3B3HVU0_ORYLA
MKRKTPNRRPCHPYDRCYRCGEPGHIARNCPAPKTRTASPEGNDNGMAR